MVKKNEGRPAAAWLGKGKKEIRERKENLSVNRVPGRHWIWGVERGGKIVSPPQEVGTSKNVFSF